MCLQVKKTKKYGRGVYATRNIKSGELIESSPVLLLDNWDSNRIIPTILNCYAFDWASLKDETYKTAIAFGFGSLFNHSTTENVTYRPNYKKKTIDFMTLCDIKKGEQLFIDYGYEVQDGIDETKKNKELAQNER